MSLTKRDRKYLGSYMRECADAMELRDWHLDLSHEGPEPHHGNAYASAEPIFGQRRAVFRFCSTFRELRPDEQRNIVVHELVHCHLASIQSMVEKDLEEPLGKAVDAMFFSAFQRSVEYATDALAAAIAKHLPLPEWPKPKKKEK